MNSDAADLAKMEQLLRRMNLLDLRRFCEGTLRAAALGQRVFAERFPEDWKQFDADVETGRIR